MTVKATGSLNATPAMTLRPTSLDELQTAFADTARTHPRLLINGESPPLCTTLKASANPFWKIIAWFTL